MPNIKQDVLKKESANTVDFDAGHSTYRQSRLGHEWLSEDADGEIRVAKAVNPFIECGNLIPEGARAAGILGELFQRRG
jgi:hypothetical protein